MFIDPGESLIVMDMNLNGVRLTLDEMRALAGIGVKTLYYQAAIRWDEMQPTPGAPLDFADLDMFTDSARRAGLKMLIPFVYSLPDWLPDEMLYSRETVETAKNIPDYTNPAMTQRLDALLYQLIRRYSAPDVQFVYSIPANGEFAIHIWPRHGNLYPGLTVQQFAAWVVARQRTMQAQHNEVWTAFHPYTNPIYWDPVYNALFVEWPFSYHYGIIFTYVQHSMPHFYKLIRDNQARGMVYFGGVEYVTGMRQNVPKLKRDGLRMFCAPKHPYQPEEQRQISDWALAEMAWAMEQYDNAEV